MGDRLARLEPVAGVEVEALDEARRPDAQLGRQRGEHLELRRRHDGAQTELRGGAGQAREEQRLGLVAGHPGQPRAVAVDEPEAAVRRRARRRSARPTR